MPVYKYRCIEDMPEPWQHFGDRNVAQRFRAALRIARYAGPLRMPRGVRKFRSLDELAAERTRYEDARRARKP